MPLHHLRPAVGLQPLINLAIDWQDRFCCRILFWSHCDTFFDHPLGGVTERLSRDTLGMMYLGTTLPFIIELRGLPQSAVITESLGGWLLLMVIVITALSDTGGYFVGRALGKTKLLKQ